MTGLSGTYRDDMLAGRVAVVTGSTDGVGLSIARNLHACGARVVLQGRDSGRGEAALAQFADPARAMFVAGNGASRGDARLLIDEAEARFGPIDILVNNVGAIARSAARPIAEIDYAGWLETFDITIHSALHTIQKVLPGMMERRWGRIINISSTEGKGVHQDNLAAYQAAKHALNGLTKAVAREAGPHGVTANAICPGLIDTPRVQRVWADGDYGRRVREASRHWLERTAIGRLVDCDEVAALVLLVASDAGSAITGAMLNVDGGLLPY